MQSDESNTKRVRKHAEKQMAKGLTRVLVWAPKQRVADIRQAACRLRQQEHMPLPHDGAEAQGSVIPPIGRTIALPQLLELIAAARDTSPDRVVAELCSGRTPTVVESTFDRIANRLGYQITWHQKPAIEIKRLQAKWIG